MRHTLATILLLVSIALFASGLYLPSLPSIQQQLLTTAALIKLTITAYFFSFSLFQIVYGPFSDRFGRKPILYIGLLVGLIGSLLCTFAPTIEVLIIARVIQGAGLAAGSTLARAILRDTYSGVHLSKAISIVALGTAVSMACGPTIGGYIETYLNWRTTFGFISVYVALGLFVVWKYLKETHPSPDLFALKNMWSSYKTLLSSPIFLGYAACSSLAFGGVAVYFAISPFLFTQSLGLTPIQYGWLGIIIAVSIAAGGVLNTLILKFLSPHKTLVIGILALVGSGILMLALSHFFNTFVIMLPMGLYTMGTIFVLTNAFAGAFHPFPHMAGAAGSLYGAIQIFGGAILSALAMMLDESNQIPLGVMLLCIGVITLSVEFLTVRYEKRHET